MLEIIFQIFVPLFSATIVTIAGIIVGAPSWAIVLFAIIGGVQASIRFNQEKYHDR